MAISCCVVEPGSELEADSGTNCRESVVETPFALADSVADCVFVTGAAAIGKSAVLAPALTVTEPGSVTAGLSLARMTTIGSDAVESRYTEQDFFCDPVNFCVPQEIDDRFADFGYN